MKELILLLLLFSGFSGAACPKTYTVSTHKIRHSKGFKRGMRLPLLTASTGKPPVIIPNSMDLRGKIGPVRNQGECGACYSFGTSSSIQDALKITGNDPGQLSPQYLMDYSGNGCEGGYFDVMKLAKSPRGIPKEDLYPYVGHDEGKKKFKPAGSIVSWGMIGGEDVTTQEIEAFMTQYGYPIPVSMFASSPDFESYSGGIFNECVLRSSDHIVSIVGFDNENGQFQKNGFLPNGVGFWIVRNSWGTNWGEGGFFRIRMTDPSGNKCMNIADEAAGFFLRKRLGWWLFGNG